MNEYYEYDVTEPEEGTVHIMKNKWFACVNNDPKRCILFGDKRKPERGSPQCNSQKAIAEMLAKPKGFDVIFLEKCFVPVDMNEYTRD